MKGRRCFVLFDVQKMQLDKTKRKTGQTGMLGRSPRVRVSVTFSHSISELV